MLDDNHLIATHLFTAQPHIFVSKSNPLAKKEIVHLSDLEDSHTLAMTKEPTLLLLLRRDPLARAS